jgi:hypothetical protein
VAEGSTEDGRPGDVFAVRGFFIHGFDLTAFGKLRGVSFSRALEAEDGVCGRGDLPSAGLFHNRVDVLVAEEAGDGLDIGSEVRLQVSQ